MSQLSEVVTSAWYQGKRWIWWLLPLTLLFWLISRIRRFCYQQGWAKSVRVNASVIIVGNISVGGTGKSPLTGYLVSELKRRGYRPGIVSRGYGGQSDSYPLIVDERSSAEMVGDEPLMLYQMSHCPVAVDPVRSRAASTLCENFDCNVVICDDGLQHYALARDIEICVIDGKRGLGNGFLLPAGPLRESSKRLSGVDFVIINGGKEVLDQSVAQKTPSLFEMMLTPQALVNVFDGRKWPVGELRGVAVHAVAGIGNPDRFFLALRTLGADVTPHAFPDHYDFSRSDVTFESRDAVENSMPVVMTHKDAVKCLALFSESKPDNLWYMPVSAEIDDQFIDKLCKQLPALAQ